MSKRPRWREVAPACPPCGGAGCVACEWTGRPREIAGVDRCTGCGREWRECACAWSPRAVETLDVEAAHDDARRSAGYAAERTTT